MLLAYQSPTRTFQRADRYNSIIFAFSRFCKRCIRRQRYSKHALYSFITILRSGGHVNFCMEWLYTTLIMKCGVVHVCSFIWLESAVCGVGFPCKADRWSHSDAKWARHSSCKCHPTLHGSQCVSSLRLPHAVTRCILYMQSQLLIVYRSSYM